MSTASMSAGGTGTGTARCISPSRSTWIGADTPAAAGVASGSCASRADGFAWNCFVWGCVVWGRVVWSGVVWDGWSGCGAGVPSSDCGANGDGVAAASVAM